MRLKPSLGGWLVLLPILAAGSRASAGTVYSAAGDFSIASNPNGVWSYGTTGTTVTGPLTLYTAAKSGIGGIADWVGWEGTQPMFGDDFPLVGKNIGATTGTSADIVLLPGELAEHPAPDGSYAVVRFTAPTSGVFLLNADFEGREFQGQERDRRRCPCPSRQRRDLQRCGPRVRSAQRSVLRGDLEPHRGRPRRFLGRLRV